MSEDMVSRAKELAYRAHAGQVDKACRPYIEHVARVASRFSGYPVSEAVAWLHDVIEDCHADFEHEIFMYFPDDVYVSVYELTRDPIVSDDDYYFSIRDNPIALRVKLADIADNASEERLALLDEKTAARLRRKYAKAIAALTGEQ